MITAQQKVPTLRFKDKQGKGYPNWKKEGLGAITNIYDGTHQTPRYIKEGIPFYSVEHVTADQFNETKFISERSFKQERKRARLEKGDILMTRIGSVGVVKFIDWDVRASFYVSLALIKKSSKFNGHFLAQYIKSESFQRELWKRTIHVAFPKKINLGEIGNCFVKLPCDEEQQKIAAFLASVDTKIAQLSTKKALWERYKKGMMQKLFNWEIRFKDDARNDYLDWEKKRLEEVSIIKSGESNRADSGLTGKYTFFDRSQDIRASNKYLFDAEAVIVAGEGQKFVPKYFVGMFDLHQRSYAIMDFKNVTGKFVFYYLTYNEHYFLSKAVGSTVKSLRLPMFKKMIMYSPCMTEQQKIANFLSAIDKKIGLVAEQLNQARTFEKGLLQQMFI